MDELAFNKYASLMAQSPDAAALVYGSRKYPTIRGRVYFYQLDNGVLIAADIEGLPVSEGNCACGIFGFHIHSGTSCSGDKADPFSAVLGHYDSKNCPHPCHSGDLPPLLGSGSRAFSACVTNRFVISEVLGRAVIIHSSPDDMHTQPSGNSGEKIACGIIRPFRQINVDL